MNMGDEVKVKVILIDDQGRIKLSRKAAMQELGESDPEPVGAPAGERRPGQRRRGGGPRPGRRRRRAVGIAPAETSAAAVVATAAVAARPSGGGGGDRGRRPR